MKKTRLFGGALMCAGLQALPAHAQVSELAIQYAADVSNLLAWDGVTYYLGLPAYYDSGINESFTVSGGTELLPFERSAYGGAPYSNGLTNRQFVSVSGDGSLSPSGVFDFQGRVRADGSYVTEFGNWDGAVSVEFRVDAPSDFELSAGGGFNNDYGGAAVTLFTSDGTLIWQTSGSSYINETVTGTLAPDTYRLRFGAQQDGSVRVEFSVIPAPTTSALLALGATVVLRRRR